MTVGEYMTTHKSYSSMLQKQVIDCLKVKDADRHQAWQEQFLKLVPSSYVTVLSSEPQQGPDGMPYFLVQIEENSKEPLIKLLNWLTEKGIGLVVHPEKEYPDYILTYGMIWFFKETHLFLSPHSMSSHQKGFQSSQNAEVVFGQPSKEFLPLYVRSILRQFFLDQGVYKPQLVMVGPDKHNMDICFCLESLGNPPVSEHEGILKAISWFLPQHYFISISQKDIKLPFQPL